MRQGTRLTAATRSTITATPPGPQEIHLLVVASSPPLRDDEDARCPQATSTSATSGSANG
jgi:hypothetical protein